MHSLACIRLQHWGRQLASMVIKCASMFLRDGTDHEPVARVACVAYTSRVLPKVTATGRARKAMTGLGNSSCNSPHCIISSRCQPPASAAHLPYATHLPSQTAQRRSLALIVSRDPPPPTAQVLTATSSLPAASMQPCPTPPLSSCRPSPPPPCPSLLTRARQDCRPNC